MSKDMGQRVTRALIRINSGELSGTESLEEALRATGPRFSTTLAVACELITEIEPDALRELGHVALVLGECFERLADKKEATCPPEK